jgi:transcriptional regulator with XRE-family HTH domain
MDRITIIKAIGYSGISQAELARRLKLSPSAFSNRLNKSRFSTEEMKEIADSLGAEYVEFFKFPDGVNIGIKN